MSENNSTILYAGLDVAKATLQLDLRGVSYRLHNTKKDHARLLRLPFGHELRAEGLAEAEAAAPAGTRLQVVLEATGGYEAALVAALHAADRPVSVIQPARARHFACAQAEHAKTDPIDAEVLTAFGEALRPAEAAEGNSGGRRTGEPPTPAPGAAQSRLAAARPPSDPLYSPSASSLVGRRAQLVAMRVAELNHAEHYTDKLLRKQSRQLLALLERQIAACEREIAAQLAADAAMAARAARVQQVPGIGPTVAAILQAQMPELGTLRDGQAAALAGLAPYPFGFAQGLRQTATAVRTKASASSAVGARVCAARSTHSASLRAFGMAAMSGSPILLPPLVPYAAASAIRHDPILRAFYQRLRAAGKVKMVALTAVMRKLIVLLNRLLANPGFQLRGAAPAPAPAP